MLGLEYGELPPEINSARIYSGPGSAPLMQAGASWQQLATELHATAESYASVIAGLATAEWLGPSSLSMAAAAAPYMAWMRATAGQAEQAAAQAVAAASAYEAAYAATVPPAAIASNRSTTMSLVQTNVFGQNTPAIATSEADYGEMWAQDVVVMEGYAGSSEEAAQLTPFTSPPATTSDGTPASAAAVAATPEEVLTDLLDAIPNPFEDLDVLVLATAGLAGASLIVALGQFSEEVRSDEIQEEELETGNELTEDQLTGNKPDISDPQFGGRGGYARRMPAIGAAGLAGYSPSVGGLSVPQSWFMPPTVRQVAAMFPGTTPMVMTGDGEGGYSVVAAAGLAGASVAGLAARGGSSTTPTEVAPAASASGKGAAAVRVAASKPAIPAAAAAAQFPGLPQGLPPGVVANLAATLAAIPGATIIVVPPDPNQQQ